MESKNERFDAKSDVLALQMVQKFLGGSSTDYVFLQTTCDAHFNFPLASSHCIDELCS